MTIRKRICCGYVVDVSVGHPIHDGSIRLLDAKGRELRHVCPNPDREWRLDLDEECVSVEFNFTGYIPKIVDAANIPQRGARIKLLPDEPVGYVGNVDCWPGDTLEVHVHSPREWRIQLHRHGLDKKLILESNLYPPNLQTVPDCPFVHKGLEWKVATKIEIPHDATSGLFSISIIDISGKCFIFPLVVAPSEGVVQDQTHFVVVGNTNTWQAYNIWGGKSRYRNFDKDPLNGGVPLPITQAGNSWAWRRVKTALVRRVFRFWRYFMRKIKGSNIRVDVSGIRLEPCWVSEPLSVRRPMPNRWLNAESPYSCYLDHLAANEWRALAWLERENFSYHYFSDQQLHRGDFDFSRYQGIVLIGHAEYWSREMYEKLHSAVVKAGVPLLNLAGNAIYQEVKFAADGGVVPQHGDFLETCADSSKLLCAATDLSVSGFAAFKLTTKSHWALKGVQGHDSGDGSYCIGAKSLIDVNLADNIKTYDPFSPGLLRGNMYGCGASGWEVDKLTGSCRNSAFVLARGVNKGGGADMILVENDDLFLFSASSIAFISSLLVDEACSHLMRNVFEKITYFSHRH